MYEKVINLLGKDFLEKINYFLTISESYNIMIENCLSHYLDKLVKDLNIGNIGKIWLSPFNANTEENGADAFVVEFTPTEEERQKGNENYVIFIQADVAIARFLTKKIYFHYQPYPKYLNEKIVPALKEFFIKFGFRIVDSEDQLNWAKTGRLSDRFFNIYLLLEIILSTTP